MVSDMELSSCMDLFYNKGLMKSLEEAHYDAIVTEAPLPCRALIAQYLSILAVYFLRGLPCGLDAESTQRSDPSSSIPHWPQKFQTR